MKSPLQQALAAAVIHTDDIRYCIAHLPPGALTDALRYFAPAVDEFSAILHDKDEVTLILAQQRFAEASERLHDLRLSQDFRLITFDLPLEHDLVGFLAAVSGVLATAAIPLMAYSAFERDHLLIHADHYARALQVINALQEKGRHSG